MAYLRHRSRSRTFDGVSRNSSTDGQSTRESGQLVAEGEDADCEKKIDTVGNPYLLMQNHDFWREAAPMANDRPAGPSARGNSGCGGSQDVACFIEDWMIGRTKLRADGDCLKRLSEDLEQCLGVSQEVAGDLLGMSLRVYMKQLLEERSQDVARFIEDWVVDRTQLRADGDYLKRLSEDLEQRLGVSQDAAGDLLGISLRVYIKRILKERHYQKQKHQTQQPLADRIGKRHARMVTNTSEARRKIEYIGARVVITVDRYGVEAGTIARICSGRGDSIKTWRLEDHPGSGFINGRGIRIKKCDEDTYWHILPEEDDVSLRTSEEGESSSEVT